MAFDRFLIAPLSTGLQKNLKPWLILDDAFTELSNMYVWRGRLRKRFGSRLMGEGWTSSLDEPLFSRARIKIGTTNGAGNIATTVPGSVFKIGQLFSIGTQIFTVYQTGAPAVMKTTGAATVHTYNTNTGAVVINGAALTTDVYFYPAEPIMGFAIYNFGAINNQVSYAYDTQFAYIFLGGFWQRSGNVQLHGNNLNFVWSLNALGILPGGFPDLFITNYHIVNPNGLGTLTDDPLWNTTTDASTLPVTWAPYSYSPSAVLNPGNTQPYTVTDTDGTHTIITNYIESALIIVQFKNRMIMLNTIENNAFGANAWSSGAPTTTGITPGNYVTSTNTQYVNRCRYSKVGDPFDRDAWLGPNQSYIFNGGTQLFAKGAGFLDAPTEESIVSAGFIKDRLIVFFERSTWELAYTGNQVLPFVWQKLNTELGSESTFSTVSFDRSLLSVGSTGIIGCNGSNVEEIDDKIPDEIYNIRGEDNGIERVFGIRDFFVDMVYWSMPSTEQQTTQVYPSQVLAYNYKTTSWAIFYDCITAFGYFEQQNARTWANTNLTWEEAAFEWDSGSAAKNFRQVIGGNQEGFIFICDSEETRNARNLQITNMVSSGTGTLITVIDHMLQTSDFSSPDTGDYIAIENIQGCTLLVNGVAITNGIYAIQFVDKDSFFIQASLVGTYTGGGTASRVSNVYVRSKSLNPYVEKGSNVYLHKVDFCVDKTSNGQLVVDYTIGDSELLMVLYQSVPGVNTGNNVLETSPYSFDTYPYETSQNTLWHSIYFQADGESVQFVIYMKDALALADSQIRTPAIAYSDIVIQGLILHTAKTATPLQ